MQCFYPLVAFRTAQGDIHFTAKTGNDYQDLVLPCGQCIGCRVERSRHWAMRCLHESASHEENSFLTLTYDDNNIPLQGQLVYRHFQLFMKRLRKAVGRPLRFYMCGEYGSELDRPHYHAILFGHGFYDDRVPLARGLYTSRFLESVWTHGMCSIGDVTFESAAYVARYCVKKVTGRNADDHYTRVDGMTGEIYQKVPEFSRMSLKPGIGAKWLEKYESDVYNAGAVMVNGMPNSVPRFYTKLLEERDGLQKDYLEASRFRNRARLSIEANDNSFERMRVKEEVFKAKLKTKNRCAF